MLIADDHAGVRTAVSRLLSPSCDVVGYAIDGATLFDATVQLRPDVVLLDLSLPGGNGLDACRRLRRVVALTAHDDDDIRQSAYDAGCSGFVWKLQAEHELLGTIRAVLDDGSLR